MNKKNVFFEIEVQYSCEEKFAICKNSLKQKLFDAVEHERTEGCLSGNSDVSADWIKVDLLTDKMNNLRNYIISKASDEAIEKVISICESASIPHHGFTIDRSFCDWSNDNIDTSEIVSIIDHASSQFGYCESSDYNKAADEICEKICSFFRAM